MAHRIAETAHFRNVVVIYIGCVIPTICDFLSTFLTLKLLENVS